MLSPETVQTLLGLSAILSPVALSVVVFLLHQSSRTVARLTKTQESSAALAVFEQLATIAIKYAQEQFDAYVRSKQRHDGLVTEGPTNGPEKKEIAIKAMSSLAAERGLKLSHVEAGIAVDAAVQQERKASLAPPAGALADPGTVYASINPGAPALPKNVGVTP